jgi:hypothetical protein
MKKLRGMRLAGHEAGTQRNRGAYRILVRNLKDRYHLEELLGLEKMILKWIFKEHDGGGINRSGSG